MNAHEHTDPHGDGLTITHDDGKTWITCTAAHAEVTVGPLAPGILTDYDMDGGVAAALIEKETQGTVGALIAELEHHRARAEKAERERDEARGALRARLGVLAEPRPLTPDAITDEMVKRLRAHLMELHDIDLDEGDTAEALRAALIEPPAHPEGAEQIAALVDAWKLTAEPRPTLPDFLASRGVRVVGEDGDPR